MKTIPEISDVDREGRPVFEKSVRWWTCLFGHTWTKWGEPYVGRNGIDVFRRRECLRCGRGFSRWIDYAS